MKRLVSIGLGALFVAISTQASLFAQASSYGSSGGGGGGSFGSSSGSFGSSSGSSAFGSSGAFGSSSTSSSGLGGSTNGANGANSGMVGMGGGGMYGGTGYGGQNGAGRAGSNSSSSSQYGNRSAGQGQFGGGQGRQAGGSRRGGTGQTQGQGGAGAGTKDQQPYFEPRIEIGFSVATPAPTVIQTSIASPWHTPALNSRFGSVNVSVQGSTVTLRGTVPSEEDRQLAAQMAMLEPTVFSVQNDLKVAAPTTPAAAPPR